MKAWHTANWPGGTRQHKLHLYADREGKKVRRGYVPRSDLPVPKGWCGQYAIGKIESIDVPDQPPPGLVWCVLCVAGQLAHEGKTDDLVRMLLASR